MDKINDIIELMKSVETSQIIDVIIAIAILILFMIMSSGISYFVIRIFFKKVRKEDIKESLLYKTVRIFLNFLGVYIALRVLKLTEEQYVFINKCFRIVVIWSVVSSISGILELRILALERKENSFNKKDKFASKVVATIIKITLYVIAAYLSFKEFNYDLGGIAAGLGIGGAIVALAAQNVVKQILAGLAIISDKPFEIGDWIEVGDIAGTVEAITWRSTKVRTTKDTIVTMDNNELIISNIINWGKIEKRVFKTDLKLPLETEEKIVEKVMNRIKFILKYNEDIIKDTIRVNLSEIQENALNISIYLETSIVNYGEYLKFCNHLNLTMLNILESQGVSLAYPGQNIYIKEDKRQTKESKSTNKNVEEKKKISPIKVKNTEKVMNLKKKKMTRIDIHYKNEYDKIKFSYSLGEEIMNKKDIMNWIIAIIVAIMYLTVSIIFKAWAYSWLIWVVYAIYRFIVK